jgi:HEAT repeat protein
MIENADDIQTPLPDWQHDPRSDEELLHAALTEQDNDLAWHAIGALHLRGSEETFEAARQLCASDDAHKRRVGAGILGQLGKEENKFHEESVTILLDMLEHEQDPDTLNPIAVALGHRKDPRAIEPLVRLKNHPDENVRDGVVFGLLTQDDERAINALIELSTDVDSDVRDWATFGIGSMIETDTPAIRDALLARTTDEDANTRGEAMVGLARRHDERVVDIVLAELEAGWYGSLLFEAATEIADPRLYPALLKLQEAWDEDKSWPYPLLEEALAVCQPRAED